MTKNENAKNTQTETKKLKTWRTRVVSVARVLAISYLALCLIARLAYPKLLFPAPSLATSPPLDHDAQLLELQQHDGTHTVALFYPPASPAGATSRTVVIFHGNGETMFGEIDAARVLRARGFGVVLVEYRGYGLTFGSGSSPSESMLYDDGEAVIQYLRAEQRMVEDQIVLWGWSLGSGVAAEMARRGHGSRLVLLAPFTSIVDMGKRMVPFLPVSLLMSHRFDTLAKGPEIKIPTVVLHGDADEVIPIEMGERVARAIPNAKFIHVTGAHHADMLYDEGTGTPNASSLFDTLIAHMK